MNACVAVNQKHLSELRRQVVDTLLEIDNINLQVNPRIRADYAKTVTYNFLRTLTAA